MKKDVEYWADVVGYNGIYQISNFGNFRKWLKTNKTFMYPKQYENKEGYLRVGLSENYNRKTYLVHRLVAEYFVDNNDNKSEVNHKDGIKHNNKESNLEWVTRSENMKHAHKTGLRNGITKRDKKGRIAKGNKS